MFSKIWTWKSTEGFSDQIVRLREAVKAADAIVIGAGSGLSTAAGLTYSGERFQKYFGDFIKKYHIRDMYSGGFYPFAGQEEYWAWWSRQIYYNRYVEAPKPVYPALYEMVGDKDYFVLTTNVDHQFQKAGFDKKRLFYTQGDYGLWQCSVPCHQRTYDNEQAVRRMMESQGYVQAEDGVMSAPEANALKMEIPTELIPKCPVCGAPMTMNLRCDDRFVQDEGWYAASEHCRDFIHRHEGLRLLFLELGVGGNTPGIIKYPFWQMTAENSRATYVCINYGEAVCPGEIEEQSICIDGDIVEVLQQIRN